MRALLVRTLSVALSVAIGCSSLMAQLAPVSLINNAKEIAKAVAQVGGIAGSTVSGSSPHLDEWNSTTGQGQMSIGLSGSFFGIDVGDVTLVLPTDGFSNPQVAARALCDPASGPCTITFSMDSVGAGNPPNEALRILIHEMLHVALSKKYPFAALNCDPDAGEACTAICAEEGAFEKEVTKKSPSSTVLACFDCSLCNEQIAYCGGALLGCCLVSGSIASNLTSKEKDSLKNDLMRWKKLCEDFKGYGPDACGNCAESGGGGGPVPSVPPAANCCDPDPAECPDLAGQCAQLMATIQP